MASPNRSAARRAERATATDVAVLDPSAEADDGGGEAALGLHEELWNLSAAGLDLRCTCGPVHLRLRSEHGQLVAPRGGCVNRCDYCAMIASVENSEMLALDATEGRPPEVLMVLGTRDAFPELPGECECEQLAADVDWTPDAEPVERCERCQLSRAMMAPYHGGLKAVKRALKRRWPDVEYASMLEYTTGYGPCSGGQRRPHWNLLFKGIPADACDDATARAARAWCRHVDAEEHAQHGTPIYSAAGLFAYLAKHFQKGAQTPPAGFTGQRFNCSRGYFGTDAATGRPVTRAMARARAQDSLRLKRELWRARVHLGDDADAYDVELQGQLSYRQALQTRWVLVSETGGRLGEGADALPLARATQLRDARPDGWGETPGSTSRPLPVRELAARVRDRTVAANAYAAAASWRVPWAVLFADHPG